MTEIELSAAVPPAAARRLGLLGGRTRRACCPVNSKQLADQRRSQKPCLPCYHTAVIEAMANTGYLSLWLPLVIAGVIQTQAARSGAATSRPGLGNEPLGRSISMSSNPIDPNDPDVIAAEKRCVEGHAGYEAYQRATKESITAQDWKTLGYNTFIDYWIDRWGDIAPTWGVLPHVVYAMIDEGNSNDAIAGAVKSVGPERATNLRRQKAAGIPADKADADVKPRRPKGQDKGTVFVLAGQDLKAYWDSLAVARNTSTSDLIIATMAQVHGRP